MKNSTKAQPKEKVVKKQYSQPVLTVYGKLQDFTAGGSGTNPEVSGMMS